MIMLNDYLPVLFTYGEIPSYPTNRIVCSLVLLYIALLLKTFQPIAPRLSLRLRAAEPRGPRPGLPRSWPTGQTGRYEKERIKNKIMLREN